MSKIIRPCRDDDRTAILAIINAAAEAYRGVIPADRWHEPYMPREELNSEIAAGVVFWGYEEDGSLAGVMGIQSVRDVDLIRHAYVLPSTQRRGIGGALLGHLRAIENAAYLDWHLGSRRLGNSVLHTPRLRVGRACAQNRASQGLLGRSGSTDGGFRRSGKPSTRRNVRRPEQPRRGDLVESNIGNQLEAVARNPHPAVLSKCALNGGEIADTLSVTYAPTSARARRSCRAGPD